MKVRYTRRALRHLSSILSHISQNSANAALAQVERIERTIDLLERFPRMGHEGRSEGTLELVVPMTPYIVVYWVRNNEIHILSVFHGKQNRAD